MGLPVVDIIMQHDDQYEEYHSRDSGAGYENERDGQDDGQEGLQVDGQWMFSVFGHNEGF